MALGRVKLALGVALVPLILSGCGSDMIARHKDRCSREARLIVHDLALWAEFQSGSQREFEARRARFGPETGRAMLEAVPGFDVKYGAGLDSRRRFVDDQINRDDVFVVQGDRIVAQYVDLTVTLRSIDGATNLHCLGSYPELYATASAVRAPR